MKNPLTYSHRGYHIQYVGATDGARLYQVRMSDDSSDACDVFGYDLNWDHITAIKDITSWIDISDPESPAG